MQLPLRRFVSLSPSETAGQPELACTHARLFVPYREGHASYVIEEPEVAPRLGPAQDLPVPPPHLLLGHADASQFLSGASSISPRWTAS